MEVAFIGQPYVKIIPIIKDKLVIADKLYLEMIKNKNFNIVNMISTNGDFNYENYKNFLI